jgi:hypothetical protein
MCEAQTSEQIMHKKFTFHVSEEEGDNDGGRRSEFQQFFWSALEGINPVRKYLMKFDIDDNTLASLSGNENVVYGVQQKRKTQELPLIDMWKT